MELLLLKRGLVKAALPMIIAFAALVPGACQDRLVYHPDKVLVSTPAAIGLEYQDVTVRTADGVLVNAWWIPSAGQRYAVLFCHGNAGNISHRLDTIRILHGLRLGVFIFDYRGFGRSEGSPSEEGTYRDAAAVWGYMTRTLEIRPCEIIVMGRSLGAAVAAWVAEKKEPAMLVLESGFFSVKDMVRHHCPLVPGRPAVFV